MSQRTREITLSALVGAAYASLTMLLSFISYGPIQFRLSEILCVLPFFYPFVSWGLFIGCAVANLISSGGIYDIVFGSLATLIAALLTARLGRPYRESNIQPKISVSVLACLMPVFVNAPIIGAVLALTLSSGEAFLPTFILFGAQVGFGELVVMLLGGVPLIRAIPRLSQSVSKGEL